MSCGAWFEPKPGFRFEFSAVRLSVQAGYGATKGRLNYTPPWSRMASL